MSSKAVAAPVVPKPFAYEEAGLRPEEAQFGVHSDAVLREAAARSAGRAEAEAEARARTDQALAEQKLRVEECIERFEKEREQYYHRVESEVVQLALAIARKILHRESQIDPLMLAGIVKVTLERLNADTEVRVRVQPQVAAEWRHFFSSRMQNRAAPDIIDDPLLGPGQCVLETSVGQTQLGIETQMKEIEQGLLDLLSHRPGEKS